MKQFSKEELQKIKDDFYSKAVYENKIFPEAISMKAPSENILYQYINFNKSTEDTLLEYMNQEIKLP